MTHARIYRTGPDHFSGHRPSTDADRLRKYGPVQPKPAEKADWFDWCIRGFMVGITLATIIFIYHGA